MKILVADDTQTNCLIVGRLIKMLGHEAVFASNGAEAVRVFQAETPDMVLMDVMMPEMDGYEATRQIRALSSDRWIPIIFLSALNEDGAQFRGLEAGGDDYLLKPVNMEWLKAKIRSMERVLLLQRQLTDKQIHLERYRKASETSKHEAAHLLEAYMSQFSDPIPGLKTWISPAEVMSGDVVLAAYGQHGVVNLILADCTGHGLAAAVTAYPVADAFYTMSTRGFSIARIAREINRKVRDIALPFGRFVAATLVQIDTEQNLIVAWCGGLPPAYVIDISGRVVKQFNSSHLPLGVLSDHDFSAEVERFQLDVPASLYLSSDGLEEVRNRDGKFFGQEQFLNTLQKLPQDKRFHGVKEGISQWLGGDSAHDDVSFLELSLPLTLPALSSYTLTVADWRFGFSFTVVGDWREQISPLVVNTLRQVGMTSRFISDVQSLLFFLIQAHFVTKKSSDMNFPLRIEFLACSALDAEQRLAISISESDSLPLPATKESLPFTDVSIPKFSWLNARITDLSCGGVLLSMPIQCLPGAGA